MSRFKDLPLEFSPGDKHRYCNSGYLLLARIIEEASGMPYREFVQQRLFDVAALTHTYCDGQTHIIHHRAAGYSRWGGKLRNAAYVIFENDYWCRQHHVERP
ncbi:MAG: beta-lactamase family protein [Pirellulaceae bacterium]|nr:beta-lactamase family protein [Pirellulaceae bacterium]